MLTAVVCLVTCSVLAAEPAVPKEGSVKDAKKTKALKGLLAEWQGPFGGVPPFDTVKVSEFKAALTEAMALNLKEMDAIAANPEAPTFENTFVAMERSGQALNRVMTLFGVWSSSKSTPEFRKVEEVMTPKLAAFRDQITQNEKLFARIKAVQESPEKSKLTAEQRRLVWVTFNSFARQGANLNAADKKTLSALNQELATLYTAFSQHQLGDEENEALVIENRADLAGLSEEQISTAAAEAQRRKLKGKWAIANTRSSMEPFLVSSTNRALREKGFKLWVSRGDMANKNNNNDVVVKILKLRAQKAKLLGYPTFAHWQLGDTMAKDPQVAMKLMLSVWAPAVDQFKKDVTAAQAIADAEKAGFAIQPWDYRHYAEKLRKAKYDLDLAELTPYLQLEHLREAMFWAAQQLYGFSFEKVEGLPVFDADMVVYEVKRANAHVGYWYFDPYARPGKQSGAWMSAYRDQHRVDGDVSTIVSNNSNFTKMPKGKAVTVSFDDANTMFHEFGHALHGLNSNVTYPSLSGTNTTRDFVEFPSQFNENYLLTPAVLKFLVNEKGEHIPASLIERLLKARAFNEGFATAEALASAIVDMRLHLAGDAAIDPKKFEADTLTEIGMPPQMVMRHRIPAFGHIFSGDGYAAGYYSYIWAEVLEHDAFAAFTEAGNAYDAKTAQRLRDTVMSVGNTVDPAEAFRNFRGRDPKADALLKSKGFPLPVK